MSIAYAGGSLPWKQRFCVSQNTTSNTSTFYPLPIPTVWGGAIPSVGQSYCDPVFGTQVLRLTDDADNYQLAALQVGAFSNYLAADGSISSRAWVMVSTSHGDIKFFDFNPVTFTTTGTATAFAPLDPGGTPIVAGLQRELAMWWSNDTSDPNYQSTVVFTAGMKLWKMDLLGNGRSVLLADWSTYACSGCTLNIPIPPGGTGVNNLTYCTASADTRIFWCAVQDNTIFAGRGFLWFKLGNTTAPAGACPNAGLCVVAKFIQGVDSGSVSTPLTVPCKVSTFDTFTYCYVLYSDVNVVGYKYEMDKTGTWIYAVINGSLSSTTNPSGLLGGLNTTAVISSADAAIVANPLATDWTTVAYKWAQGLGHGTSGNNHRYGIEGGYICSNCMRDYVSATLTTDPGNFVPANIGVLVSPVFGFGMAENIFLGSYGGPEITINTYGAGNRFAGDPLGFIKWRNEVLWCDFAGSTCLRSAHTREAYTGTFEDEGHIVKSPDGKYAATGTAWDTNVSGAAGIIRSVMIVRRPN